MSNDSTFDPAKYLSKVSGSDYLEVKWRLLWLRTEHPDAEIDTDCISFNETFAVFKAKVSIPGRGSATGWGSETVNDFRDHIEKAETKAIGRALAALGFGTQFSKDYEFGADTGRIVDAPVTRQDRPRDAQPRQQASGAGNFYPATEKQINTLRSTLNRLHGNPLIIDTLMSSGPGIDKRDASKWIGQLIEGTIPAELSVHDAETTVQSGPPDPPEPDDYDEVALFNAAHPAERFTN